MDRFLLSISGAASVAAETVDDVNLTITDLTPGGTNPSDDLFILGLGTPNGEELYFNRETAARFASIVGEIIDRYGPYADAEISAMEKVYRAYRSVDPDAFDRINEWVMAKLSAEGKSNAAAG